MKIIINMVESDLKYLYDSEFKMIKLMIIRNSGTELDADDIMQEVAIFILNKIRGGNFKLTSKLSTYLYSVAKNLWLKELNKRSKYCKETERDIIFEEYETSEADIIERDDDIFKDIITKSLKSLSKSESNILSLYYLEDLSMADICKELGYLNPNSAKTSLTSLWYYYTILFTTNIYRITKVSL